MLERRVGFKEEEIARLRTELTASTQQLAEAQRSMSRIAATYQVRECLWQGVGVPSVLRQWGLAGGGGRG